MRIVVSLVLVLIAAGSALIFSAARSDFSFRGCPDIPRDEWEMTLNCSDGSLAQIVFGGVALISFALAILTLMRRPVA